MKMIDIFQEGFNIRMLNPYQFEDINDFDLDFNCSIQQLLSVYSTTAFEIGNLIYDPLYSYGPVIQLNLKDTVSNDSSINYYVHHLTSPEFVFATITKEIINALPNDDEKLAKIIKLYEKEVPALLETSAVIRDLNNRKLINITYFFNDAFRYVWTYNMKFELFYYWFWTYNFQNASLYSEMGLIDENHFEKELFRILFVAKFFFVKNPLTGNTYTDKVICPLPELETYWDRHFEKISAAVTVFVDFLVDKGISHRFGNYIENKLLIIMEKGEEECSLTKRDGRAAIFLANIEGRHSQKAVNLGKSFKRLLEKRYHVFCDENMDKPVPGLTENSILYFEWYMWRYLNRIYELNGKKISLVRRNWRNGKPMTVFMENKSTANLYSVDQTGGLFFEDMQQQNLYFQHSAQVLTDLWHFSMVRKKKFIVNKLPKKKNDKKSKNKGTLDN